MPFDGNGTYTLPSPAAPAIPGATITAADRNTIDNDLANALSNALCRDGQSSATGNLPMGGNKLTGLAAGSAAGDSLRFEQLFGAVGPATAAGARANLGAEGYSRVFNLYGAPNAASPLTTYDISCEAVLLRNSTGERVLRTLPGSLSCNLSTAGPAVNGRDQAAAFAANSWVYVYYIWNGAILATLASAVQPTLFTGATLPAGYTHWAFATALRWNGVSQLIPCHTRGSKVYFDGGQSLLVGGSATVETALNLSGLIPPNALSANLTAEGKLVTNTSGGGVSFLAIRSVSGSDTLPLRLDISTPSASAVNTSAVEVPNLNQQIYYLFYAETNPANIGSRSATVIVRGFSIPNGDSA